MLRTILYLAFFYIYSITSESNIINTNIDNNLDQENSTTTTTTISSITCQSPTLAGHGVADVLTYDTIIGFHSESNDDKDKGTDNTKIRLGQSLTYHFLILEAFSDGSCTVEVSISRYEIVQKLTKDGEWIKQSSSEASDDMNNEAYKRVPSLVNPFYFTMNTDGRISQVHYLPGDDERTIALKKGIVSMVQIIIPQSSNHHEEDETTGVRRLRSWDDMDTANACSMTNNLEASQWITDEIDNSGVYRALYTVNCINDNNHQQYPDYRELYTKVNQRFLQENRNNNIDNQIDNSRSLLLITKDRNQDSYYSLGHVTGNNKRGAAGQSSLFLGHTSTYAIDPQQGFIVGATIHAAAGLQQGADWMPPPGHPQSVADNAAEALPSRTSINRVVSANITYQGVTKLSRRILVSSEIDELRLRGRLLSIVQQRETNSKNENNQDNVKDIRPSFTSVDANGDKFSYHGLPVLNVGRQRIMTTINPDITNNHQDSSAVLARRLFKSESLLVEMTNSFRSSVRSSINANTNDDELTDAKDSTRRLFAETKTTTFTQSQDEETGHTVLEYIRAAKAGLDVQASSPNSLNMFPGSTSSTADKANTVQRKFTSPHDILMQHIACLPAHFYDDSLPSPAYDNGGHMECMRNLVNATRVYPELFISIHRLLLRNPCLNPYISAANRLRHPEINSTYANWYEIMGQTTQSLWVMDQDGTACDDIAIVRTVLSHRLVELLVGVIASSLEPDQTHAEAMLVHILLRPDLYRYPSTLESVFKAMVAYDTPSEVFVEAIVHAAFHIEDGDIYGVQMHDSKIWTLALLSASTVLNKARSFHDGAQPNFDVNTLINLLENAEQDEDTFLSSSSDRISNYKQRLETILSNRKISGGGKYNPDYYETLLYKYALERIEKHLAIHEKVKQHHRMATEVALLMWPTLQQHQQVHYMALAEQVTDKHMETLMAIDAARGSYTDAEATYVSIRGVNVLRDMLLQNNFGQPEKLEDIRFGIVQKHMKRTFGKNMTNVWNATHAKVIHNQRKLQASTLQYTFTDVKAAYHNTDIFLRILGNMGTYKGLDIALDFSQHHDQRLQEVAIRTLQRAGSTYEIPVSKRGRRMMHKGSHEDDLHSLIAEYSTIATAEQFKGIRQLQKNKEDEKIQDNPDTDEGHSFSNGFSSSLILDHPSLFSHSISGTSASDTEGFLVELFLSHHDFAMKSEIIKALTKMKPLSYSTVDTILDFYERTFAHTGFKSDTCTATCMASKPTCLVIPQGHCRADCESECALRSRLQVAISEFVKLRLELEHGDANQADMVWHDEIGGHIGQQLHASSRRVEEILSNDLSTSLKINTNTDLDSRLLSTSDGNKFLAWVSGDLDLSKETIAHLVRIALPSNADTILSTSDNKDNNASISVRNRVLEVLADNTDPSVTMFSNPLLYSRRRLSYRSLSGRPLARHVIRARHLGIFTLIDVSIGKLIKFSKLFGSNSFGARIQFENRNILKIRQTLFDFFFRAEEFNAAACIAQLMVVRLSIIESKAAIVGGFAFLNKIARDVADSGTKLIDNTIGFLASEAGPIMERIKQLLAECETTVQSLQTYNDALTNVIDNSEGLVPGIEAAFTIADSFASVMSTLPEVILAEQAANGVVRESIRSNVKLNRVLSAASTRNWNNIVTTVVTNSELLQDTSQNYMDEIFPYIYTGADLPGSIRPAGLDMGLGLFDGLSNAIEKSLNVMEGAMQTYSRPEPKQFAELSEQSIVQIDQFSTDSNIGKTATLQPNNLVYTFNDVQYSNLLYRSFSTMFAPITTVLSPISRAIKQLDDALADPALVNIDESSAAKLPSTFRSASIRSSNPVNSTRLLMENENDNINNEMTELELVEHAERSNRPARKLGLSDATTAATRVSSAMKTLHTAVCGTLPLFQAAIRGTTAGVINTDIGEYTHTGKIVSISTMRNFASNAAALAEQLEGVKQQVIFKSPGGIVYATDVILLEVIPVIETLLSRSDFIEELLQASKYSMTPLRFYLEDTLDIYKKFNTTDAPVFINKGKSSINQLYQSIPVIGDIPTGISSLSKIALSTLMEGYVPVESYVNVFSDIISGMNALSERSADWKEKKGNDEGYYELYLSGIEAIQEFQVIHADYTGEGLEARRLAILLQITEFIADFPIKAIKDLTVAIRTASAFIQRVESLTEIIDGYLDFLPKLEEVDKSAVEIESITTLYSQLLQEVNTQSFITAYTDASNELKTFIDNMDIWTKNLPKEGGKLFNISTPFAQNTPAVVAMLKPVYNQTIMLSYQAALHVDTLLASLAAVKTKIGTSLNSFKLAASSVQQSRTIYSYWDRILYPTGKKVKPLPQVWKDIVQDLDIISQAGTEVNNLNSLLKILSGGIDESTCTNFANTNGDVSVIYNQATSNTRRRLLSVDDELYVDETNHHNYTNHEEILNEKGYLMFATDEKAQLNATRMYLLPNDQRRLQSSSPSGTNRITSEDIAIIKAGSGIKLDPNAATISLSTEFCFTQFSTSPECTLLKYSMERIMSRIRNFGKTISTSRMNTISQGLVSAMVTAPKMSADLSQSTLQIMDVFQDAAKKIKFNFSRSANEIECVSSFKCGKIIKK